MIETVRGGIGLLGAALAMLLAAAVVVAEAPKSAAETLVELYVPMQEALARDSVAGVKEQAARVAAASAEIHAGGEEKSLAAVTEAAKGMTASDIATLREQFKPLSTALARLVEKQPVAGHGIYFCPMADAYWVQKQDGVANPYYGKSMLRCGEQVKKVEE